VNLRVDHTRQNMEAGAVDGALGAGPGEVSQYGNPAVSYANVARGRVLMRHNRAIGENEIEKRGHGCSLIGLFRIRNTPRSSKQDLR
jgi:hypothetical protein